jgi:ring-1,2-phenylacetyl-CoA epoxidase subunit PaaC
MEEALLDYTLHLADNSLIMGHRLSEWTGHGPVLEQDIAITNIALDLIGQARNFYQYAALIKGKEYTEDSLAYLRDANDFKNFLIAELPNGDWAKTILKVFFFSTYQYLLYEKLTHSDDKQLSAIAEKSLKEVTYHLRWSSEWVVRLGDGTEESHRRVLNALNELWDYTREFFFPFNNELQAATNSIVIDVSLLKNDWNKKVKQIFDEAILDVPKGILKYSEGENHTKHLSFILSEMRFLQRTYPSCNW